MSLRLDVVFVPNSTVGMEGRGVSMGKEMGKFFLTRLSIPSIRAAQQEAQGRG